ncbi:MAG: DNA polymerase III subunit delta [Bacteroidota bacterium]
MAAEGITDFNKILNDLKAKKYALVYFLYGEEHFYIDEVSSYIEKNVLTDGEKGFNQTIFYGKDADAEVITSTARRFPMMAPLQVIIVKEAQGIKSMDGFISYLEKPVATTLLVICYKKEKIDRRTAFYKAFSKHVVFDSKKLYDNQLQPWIKQYLSARKFTISDRAAQLIADSLGSDLSKIANELEKLIINKNDEKEITDTDVELKIGISREFNIFELINAIAQKNSARAFHIAHHMSKSKEFSIIATLINMNNFFNKAYIVKQSNIKDRGELQKLFDFNYYQANDYLTTSSRYSADELEKCIRIMHEYDLKSKGVNNVSASPEDLLKEILVKIL